MTSFKSQKHEAGFDDSQRQATVQAAIMAGLEDTKI